MRRRRNDVTDAELAVLKLIWERGPSTIRSLVDSLYPGGDPAHYGTVQKLLERLERKSCVTRRSEGRANVYSAAIARDDLIARRLNDVAEKLCDGSLTPLLTELVGSARLTAAERAELRKLVRRLETGEDGGDR